MMNAVKRCAIVVVLLMIAAPAGAAVTFLNAWGTYGTGAGQFGFPVGVAVSPTGQVYVADMDSDRIQRFSADGTYETQWGSSGSNYGEFYSPIGVAVAPSGQVYVADAGNNRIQRFSSDGTHEIQWGYSGTGDGQFDGPFGVTVGPSGQVYVADYGNNRIQRFSADGAYETKWGTLGSSYGQFIDPYDMAVSPGGLVYVVDSGNNRIQRFTSSGGYQLQWGSYGTNEGQFNYPTGIAISANDLVYVADSYNDRIQRFSADGTYETQWGSSGSGSGQFAWPFCVAVGPTGLVYVTDSDNYRVQRFFDYDAWVAPATHYLPDSIEFDSDFTLDGGKSLIVPGAATVSGSWLRLTGGSLNSQSIDLIGGALYYQAGTLSFQELNAGLLYVANGSPLAITQGMVAHPDDLVVESYASLQVAGGEVLTSGNANTSAGAVVAVSSGLFGAGSTVYNSGDLLLGDAVLARVSAAYVENNGTIRGSGRVEAPLLNNGEVRVGAGEKLRIGQSGLAAHFNTGLIEAIGNPQYGGPAEVEFVDWIQNYPGTGMIAARNATLRFDGGLDNQGSLAFSFGTSDVFGDISSIGDITLAGGAEVTFYDDVDGIGGSMVIAKVGSTTSKAVMFGSWNAGFSGGGELFAFGDLRPGASPAEVTMGGDLFLGPSTNTYIEIGGLAPGSEYDVVNVTGDAAIDGDLVVSLIDPLGGGNVFAPSAGDTFEILTAGDLLGTFGSESFPAIPGKPGLEWLVDYDYTEDIVQLSVVPIFEADFDEDGDVDDADLARWRSGFGSGSNHDQGDADLDGDVDLADLMVWQRQLGSSISLAAANVAIPEPAGIVLAFFFFATVLTARMPRAVRDGVALTN